MENPPIEAEIVPKTEALAVRQPQAVAPGLFGTQEPAVVIERAKIVAQALKDVIVKQGLVSKIQGKEYPRCEAWTLLGTMLGVFPVLYWSRPVDGGWEARVEARTKDGSIVGAAEAQCLKSERNWSNRDDFALRSMAQTRATAKCLRMPLGFVMSLGGFEPTPAEEMVADHPHKPTPQPPRAPTPPNPGPFPTEKTRSWFISKIADQREAASQFLIDLAWMMPTESLENMPLRFVPTTQVELSEFLAHLGRYREGGRASEPYSPHEKPDEATTPAKATKDDEAWRDVIVPIPHRGERRDDYLKHPDTLGSLYDLRHGNDEEAQAARQRLWGICEHHAEAKAWTGKDGKERPPSDSDIKFAAAVREFKAWWAVNHPDEKL